MARVFLVASSLESGLTSINECAMSNELGPFGDVKESGLGHEGVSAGHGEDCLEVKCCILVDFIRTPVDAHAIGRAPRYPDREFNRLSG
ncbi:hypothetical protein BG74_07120 [Sodalis-like endosymbiont of Proechinophthirus fluctus]|nr:hypothetical protein BG74_07120 [Sodalis-like endosymbiont of Proechinophthirus fluctus]